MYRAPEALPQAAILATCLFAVATSHEGARARQRGEEKQRSQ